MVIISAVFAVIVIHRLEWGYLDAISLAQLVVISILLEKPTDISRQIGYFSSFKFLIGFWLLLVPILTNGYVGLSITTISSPLEAKSVTTFNQLTKPGCEEANTECHISRIKRYTAALNIYSTMSEILKLDVGKTDKYIRKFDVNHDFVLLAYSLNENILAKNLVFNIKSNFVARLLAELESVRIDLSRLKLADKVVRMKFLGLLDFSGPGAYHIHIWRISLIL